MKLSMKFKRACAAMCAVGMVLILGACGKPQEKNTSLFPGTAGENEVVINVTSEPTEMNHMFLSDSISDAVLRHSMSGLTRLDKNDKPVNDIAQDWDVSQDGTVYTIRLRRDAVWSNGDPVTANDFYFSWVTQMKKDTGSPMASLLYQKIKNGQAFYDGKVSESDLGVKVLDDYTLEVTWETPMPLSGFYFALPVYYPMNQKAYEAIGADKYAKDVENMVTNGAYTISGWVHDDHILLSKSGTYFNQDLVKIPQVKLVMIGDNNTSLNAFKAGEIDVTNIYSDQIETIKSQDANAIKSYIDGGSWYLDYNFKNKFLANANIRRALSYSIDVQSLLDNVIQDGSIAADGFVPGSIALLDNGSSYATNRGSLFSYNPEAAKNYLNEGLKELGVSAGDVKLAILTSDTTYNQNQSAYLQQQWKEKLGINVEIRVMTNKAKVAAQNAGDYDMYVRGWGPTENEPITFLEIYASKNPNNVSGYASSKYDSLLSEALAQNDIAKRQELFSAAEKLLIDDGAIGPLYFTRTTYGISGKLQGMVRTPFQLFNLTDGASLTK